MLSSCADASRARQSGWWEPVLGGLVWRLASGLTPLAQRRRRWDACLLFERFTEEARAVLATADGEAKRLHHLHVGDGHFLLGLLGQEAGSAAGVLSALGVDSNQFRARLIELVPPEGDPSSADQLPFTPRAKKVLELGLHETLSLGAHWIRPEMLLLALAREHEGVAMQILAECDVSSGQIRNAVMEVLPDHRRITAAAPGPQHAPSGDVAAVFERLTERARQVVLAAQEEARELQTEQVGSEALLLGLLRVEDGLGAWVLGSFDVTLDQTRARVARRVSVDENPAPVPMPFAPRARQVLEGALHEARAMGHRFAGTEHVLLGIARVDEGVAIEVLREFDVDGQKIRRALASLSSRPPDARRRTLRSTGRASVGPRSVLEGGFRVTPGGDVIRILMNAAARALQDERTEMIPADLLIALAQAEQTGPLLARLGAGEAALRAALETHGTSEEPSEPPGGS
jgi:ATP-dependent Clp protease ATP-binding subunit ClpA